MQPTYDPRAVEARWYQAWDAAGIFSPDLHPQGSPFCLVLPPPNVTGSLHVGHALNHTIQDAIARRRRLQGFAVLWLPGTDHAGIATQNVVERELASRGISRQALGRERFIEAVWAWKQTSGGSITAQMRKLGDSCDWSRERFTLDAGLSRAVREVFVRLYEEGLIYRGRRIINWCPDCHTALSDIEVEYVEEEGELVHIRYPFADGDGYIVVATSRPETMLGDTGVAVHPADDRYRAQVGRTVRLPLLGREIPVVADPGVDPEFGTGAVKLTPAHDPLDFEIAERAGLPPLVVIDEQGKVTGAGGVFAGLDRFAARQAVKEALEAEGLVEKIERRLHSVGRCYRSDTVVEPLLSMQWFVAVRPLSEPAIQAVREGRTRFFPQRWENSYFHWMENLRDWCISRQIWWGHRIPAFFCDACGTEIVTREDPTACPQCGATQLRQDEDVLDTWFSSALWPFSTLGWPDQTPDLERYYPNAVMVTGLDIINFWVARMLQMGIHFTGEQPFPDVVIHGLVRAADGRKMSKSLGNVIDPLEVIDQFGADSLRLALLQAATPGQDVRLAMEWVEGARKFGNKLWNATRFVLGHLGTGAVPAVGGYPENPTPEGRWILARLAQVTERFDRLLDEYRFSDAYGSFYSFAWSEVFDWYLELAKARLNDPGTVEVTRQTLGVVLRDLLVLFHPAIPFLTEELWSELVGEGLLAASKWPAPPPNQAPASMGVFQELVEGVRRFRAAHRLGQRQVLDLVLVDSTQVAEPWWELQLGALGHVRCQTAAVPPGDGYTRVLAGAVEGFIPLAASVDLESERQRIGKAIVEAESLLAGAVAKLANPDFRGRAPAAVVEKEEGKRDEAAAKLDQLRSQLATLH